MTSPGGEVDFIAGWGGARRSGVILTCGAGDTRAGVPRAGARCPRVPPGMAS